MVFCFRLIFGVKIWCFRKQFLSSIRDWEVIFFYKCKSKVGSRKCMSWAFQILSYFCMLKRKWPHNLWLKIRTGFLNTRFWPPTTKKRKKLIFSINKVRHFSKLNVLALCETKNLPSMWEKLAISRGYFLKINAVSFENTVTLLNRIFDFLNFFKNLSWKSKVFFFLNSWHENRP